MHGWPLTTASKFTPVQEGSEAFKAERWKTVGFQVRGVGGEFGVRTFLPIRRNESGDYSIYLKK